MEPSEVAIAVEAARSVACAMGLRADDAVMVHNSNRVAVRLTPCDALARVAPPSYDTAAADLEIEVARGLAETGSPAAEPDPRVDPRVHIRDGYAITLWTFYEPVASPEIAPGEYARALAQLHAGLRGINASAPHFTDRVADAQRLLSDRQMTPELPRGDRELLSKTLSRLSERITRSCSEEQLLHGEPHLGNVLRTSRGLLFIDLETCCRGPVEFDIAHGLLPDDRGHALAAEEVSARYPGANLDVIEQCRILIRAMITTWRWDRNDSLPNGRLKAVQWLQQLRAALEGNGLGT